MKAEVESNLNPLKEAVKNQNVADIDRYSEALSKAFEKMYQAGAQAGQAGPQGGFDPNQGGPQGGPQGPGPDYGGGAPDEQQSFKAADYKGNPVHRRPKPDFVTFELQNLEGGFFIVQVVSGSP